MTMACTVHYPRSDTGMGSIAIDPPSSRGGLLRGKGSPTSRAAEVEDGHLRPSSRTVARAGPEPRSCLSEGGRPQRPGARNGVVPTPSTSREVRAPQIQPVLAVGESCSQFVTKKPNTPGQRSQE